MTSTDDQIESDTSAGSVADNDKAANDASGNSSPQDDTSDSSTESGADDGATAKSLGEFFEARDKGGEDSQPETQEADDPPAGNGSEAAKDGQAAEASGDGDKALLQSQGQDAEFQKAFSERQGWQKAMQIARKAGPEAEKEMRKNLREFYQREQSLVTQVERIKPAAAVVDRIRRCVGEQPEALENSVRLIEGWQQGTDEAEQMLQGLLEDLQKRKGRVVSSPDLLEHTKKLKERLDAGLIDEETAAEQRALISETEKARAQARVSTEHIQREQQQRTEAQQREFINGRIKALDDWEKTIRRSDPDYNEDMQQMVIALAGHEKNRREAELKRDLTAQEMVEETDRAYQRLKKRDAKAQPKPRRQVITGDGSSNNQVEQEPEDYREGLKKFFQSRR